MDSAGFDRLHARSLADPAGFWGEAAKAVTWSHPCDRIVDDGDPRFARWFAGARLNTCYNALDRHVLAGRGAQAALIWDSPMAGAVTTLTYAALLDDVARLAGAMRALGVTKGDRVIIYMPMIPEAVAAMLACARLGAVHSVVFGGFAAPELAARIDDAEPRLILSASCGLEPGRIIAYKPLLDAAIALAVHRVDHCLILQRPQLPADLDAPVDLDWATMVAQAEPADCVEVEATDPLYILYTSGTTGKPKGVVRDNGGHAVALLWTMRNFYGVQPGETFWAASDIGWVVGHSYIVYGPLLQGCTTVLYEGKPVGTPDAGAFWRVIADHRVSVLFTAPTALRAIRREDSDGAEIARYDIASLRALFLAGERSDPTTIAWAESRLSVPVIDHWWQTETGWPIAGNPMGLHLFPTRPGSATRGLPGWDVQVLDDAGNTVPAGVSGALAIRLPLPPGALTGFWRGTGRYIQDCLTTFPGFYETGDAGFADDDKYLHILSRTDDVINVAGHRLSTGVMEEIVAAHPAVAECAVIGAADSLKGQVPLGLVVLRHDSQSSSREIEAEIVRRVRETIGPVASFREVMIVARLPKTRSGKILRGSIRKIADGEPWTNPATIEDPTILAELAQQFQNRLETLP
jgi:propionyl-CoA synthetase